LIVNPTPHEQPKILFPLDPESTPPYFEHCRSLTTNDYVDDINIFTEFGDLTPTQVFTLFNQFINWPEYKECSFNASLESTLMKLNSNVENVNELDIIGEEVNAIEKK
jgi:dimethyladenosine transferase 2, mitochondrial